jgi:hypothetical protein
MEQMASCTDIILMKGWPESRGARSELDEAIRRNFKVWLYDNDELILMSKEESDGET